MTQDEIIRMAREAGFETCGTTGQLFNKDLEGYCQEELERFAALVAEATKAKYEKKFDEVFGELIEKIKGGMSAEAAIRSLK